MMQSKPEIISEFKSKWLELDQLINQISEEDFTAKPNPDVWSIAEEFDHVILSASVVCSAMKRLPIFFRWKFGKPNRPIRSYDEVLAKYTNALASVGGRVTAPSIFTSKEGKVLDRNSMLKHWQSTVEKFEKRINTWRDKSLDNVLIPHPLLGKMMMREMLYFTHIHTEHHRKSLENKAASLLP